MSETTETKTGTSTKAKGEIGPSMIGSEILVSALERERGGGGDGQDRHREKANGISRDQALIRYEPKPELAAEVPAAAGVPRVY